MPSGWRASSSHRSSTRSNFSANERSRSAGARAELILPGCGRASLSQSPHLRSRPPRPAFRVPSVCLQCAYSLPPILLAPAPRRLGEPDASCLLRFSFDSPSILPRLSRVADPCSGRGVSERTPRPCLPGYSGPMPARRVQHSARGRLDGAGARRPGERAFGSCPAKLCRASSPSARLRRIRLPRHLPGRRAPATSSRCGPPRRSPSAQGSMGPGHPAPVDGTETASHRPSFAPVPSLSSTGRTRPANVPG